MNTKTNPRAAAVEAVVNIEEGDFIQGALNSVISKYELKRIDIALVTEIVYGTVRMQKLIDYYLSHISKLELCRLEAYVRSILRVGAYQIIFLDRIPVSAAVNESVKLAPKKNNRKVRGFINGVLRNIVRKYKDISLPPINPDPIEHISIGYSHPRWMVTRWLKQFGIDNTIKLCQLNNARPLVGIRVNTIKTTLSDIIEYLARQNIPSETGKYAPDVVIAGASFPLVEDPYFLKGFFYLQSESSALVAHAVQPSQGQLIYDLCAAPGGKTTHLAQLMHNQGEIIALDQTESKIRLIKDNLKQQGISIVRTRVGDATSIKLPPADKVLIDAPCSGLGVLRQNPDIKWRRSLEDISELRLLQKRIMTNAANLVKPGGELIYSTCTIEPEENESLIHWFLTNNPKYKLKALPTWFPPGNNVGMLSILPFMHGIDGFFICKMVNIGT